MRDDLAPGDAGPAAGVQADSGFAAAKRASLLGGRTLFGLPLVGFLLLGAITVLWGVNWPMMKLALEAVPPWDFRTVCSLTGAVGILTIARASGQSLAVPRSQIGPLLLCALFNVVGWHVFSAYGVGLMPAGRASIIAFTMPLWASLLSIWVLREPASASRLIGLGLGLLSLAVLIGPEIAAYSAAPLGAVMMLGAALSWGLGTVLMKRFHWSISTASLAGWQQAVGIPAIGLGAWLLPGQGDWSGAWTWPQAAGFLYAISVPMIFCFWAWFTVVRLFPAPVAAIGTLAIPVVGVFSGAVLLGETVGGRELLALVLVVAALAVVLVLPGLAGRWRSPSR